MWKILLLVLALLVVLVVAIVGAGITFFNGMKDVAQDIYGGPTPAHVTSLVGMDMQTHKIAVFLDMQSQLPIILVTQPLPKSSKPRPLSDPDVQKALESFKAFPDVQGLLEGSENGETGMMKVAGHDLHTLQYAYQGNESEAGVLNLDDSQMLFIITGGVSDYSDFAVESFLLGVPAVQNDSRFKPSATPSPEAQPTQKAS